MSYRIYTKMRRNYRKRTGNRSYNRSAKSTASKALAIAKKNQKREEVKFIDSSIVTTATAYTNGIQYLLSSISAGSQNSNRVGNKINPTSLHIQWDWANSTTTGTSWRFIVFQWKDNNPPTANALSILATATLDSFKAENYQFNSKILRDVTYFDVNRDVQKLPTKWKIPLKGFMGFSDASAAPIKNGLFLLALSDNGSASLNMNTRMYYKDY